MDDFGTLGTGPITVQGERSPEEQAALRQLAEQMRAAASGVGAMAPEGVDVSSHDGVVDWYAAVRDARLSFAFVKATEGNGYTNPYYRGQRDGAKAAGLYTGSYHYWRPEVDAQRQADYFVRAITPMGAGDLQPAIDIEIDPGQYPDYTASQLIVSVYQLALAVEQATGLEPIIYTYPWFWRHRMADSTLFHRWPLWIAGYGVPRPSVPGSWPTHTFWQYTSSGRVRGIRGGTGDVDRDRFNGTIEALRRFAL